MAQIEPMKKLIVFLLLAVALAAAPTTPISNAVIQVNGIAQTGVLAGNGAGVATATATGAQISTALDLIGSTRGSVLYRGSAGWSILAPGTSGYVLTSAGAGADPAWSPEGSVGTVTSFSAGNLSPLFTTNVATATTTPALTFSLSDAAANRIFAGPASGPNAPPTFRALVTADMPSGTGDVIGPASSTLNAWPLFADTTGKLLKNSDVTYSSPTLTVPAGFGITGAGALNFTAGGSNQNVTITPSGTGAVIAASAGLSGSNTIPAGATARALEVAGTFVVNAPGFGPQIEGRRFGTSYASPSAVTSGQTLLNILGNGYNGTSFTFAASAISIGAAANWSNTSNPTAITFNTTPIGATSNQIRVRVENYGGLSFGVNPPSGGTAAWGVNGVISNTTANTWIDNSSSGTVASAVASSFAVPTFAASSATTFTNAANLYIAGDVAAGTNVTLTNSYGLWNAGKTRLDGAVSVPTAAVQLGNDTTSTWHLNVFSDNGSSAPAWQRNVSSRLLGTLTANDSNSYRSGDFFAQLNTSTFNLTGTFRGVNGAVTLANDGGTGTHTLAQGGAFNFSFNGGAAGVLTTGEAVNGTAVIQGAGTIATAYSFRAGSLRTNGSVTTYYAYGADDPATNFGTTLAATIYSNWSASTGRYGAYFPGTVQHLFGGTLRLGSTTGTTLVDSSGAFTLTGGAGNMTITAGTGNSRTLTLQTTTSGGTATNAVVFDATQKASFNGPLVQKVSALTYASPTSVDVTLANVYTVTTVNATGSVTFNATGAGTSGQPMTIIITNDATSAKTITFGSNFTANGTLTASGASKKTTIQFISDGSSFVEVSRTVLP